MAHSPRLNYDLNWIAVPPMLKLSKLTNESIDVSILQGTENTIVDRQLFNEHLHQIKQAGYALDNEEGDIGVRCIAAPIYPQRWSNSLMALTTKIPFGQQR